MFRTAAFQVSAASGIGCECARLSSVVYCISALHPYPTHAYLQAAQTTRNAVNYCPFPLNRAETLFCVPDSSDYLLLGTMHSESRQLEEEGPLLFERLHNACCAPFLRYYSPERALLSSSFPCHPPGSFLRLPFSCLTFTFISIAF